MLLNACPPSDELRLFLDEDMDEARRVFCEHHVDSCKSCQGTLEEIIRGHDYGLGDWSTELQARSRSMGYGVRPDGETRTQPPSGFASAGSADHGARAPREGTEHGASFILDDQSTIDHHEASPGWLVVAVRDQADGIGAEQADRAEPGPDGGHQGAPLRLPRIPSYELLDVLGEGGMGVVYRARQRGLNRLVAIKMIRGGGTYRSDNLARFRIEAEAVARIRHVNILQIYEIGEVEGAPYVSFELLGGGSLEHRLAGTPQSGHAAAELLATLARAIQVAHDAGIVHRDLKPSNVLFSEDGPPKITDFGLAKRLESDSRQTETGAIMGTPSYMAPEQASGHTRDVGPAADVYALGAMLYEMLTGRPPFKGETPMDTVRMVVSDDPVPPSRLVSRVERDLETICLKCLSKEPHRRYASAAALADDLERYRQGETIQARRTPLWERGVKWSRRHPAKFAGLVTGTLAAGMLLAAAITHTQYRDQQERLEAHRVNTLRAASNDVIYQAQRDMTRNAWGTARDNLRELRSKLENEAKLRDLHSRAGELLATLEFGIAENQARAQDRARYDDFLRRRNEALFYETQFTGLNLAATREAAGESARAALAVFAASDPKGRWDAIPLSATYSDLQKEEIREGCYELLLVMADAVDRAAEGLFWLDAAARLRPPTRAYHFRRADCLERTGDIAAARSEREAASRLTPSTALDHFLMGKLAYKSKDWDAALQHFDAALLLKPEHFWSHCLAAISGLQLRRPVAAKAELNACLQVEREFSWLFLLRGFASYQTAVLARSAAETLNARGNTLRAEIQQQLEAAEADYARALALLEKKPNRQLRYASLVNRGLLRVERRDWERAVADFQEAIQLDARQYLAHESLSQALHRQGKHDAAGAEMARAIALRPELPALHRARAAIDVSRKDPSPAQRARALRDLEQAIRLESPGNPVLCLDHTGRGRLLLQGGRDLEALEASEAALKLVPDHAPAHQLRLEVLLKLKRYDELLNSCDALLARGKGSTDLYQLRGLAREHRREYAAAIEDFTQAIALRPDSARLRVRRGGLYLMIEAARPALHDFEDAIRLDPSNPDAYVGRGQARAALGQYEEAVADAARALRLAEPTAPRLYNAARIHARAALAATSDVRRKGLDAVTLVNHYQDQAVSLVREAHRRLPESQRASFLREVAQNDPALSALRRRLRTIEPAAPLTR